MSVEREAEAPISRHDRVVLELIAAGGDDTGEIVVFDTNGEVTLLEARRSGVRVVVLGATRDVKKYEPLLKLQLGRASTHVVMIDLEESEETWVASLAPTLEVVAVGFHRVNGDRILRTRGVAVPWIERTRIGEQPLDRARLAEARRRGEAAKAESVSVAKRLTASKTITVGLVAACVAIAGVTWLCSPHFTMSGLYRMGANSSGSLRDHQLYRLMASMFLHFDAIHLGSNMLVLYVCGRLLESVLGRARFLILYTASGLAGSLASALLLEHGISAGASGAIWGLMAGSYAAVSFGGPILPAGLVVQLRTRLAPLVLLNALISFLPGIDWRAHAGGAVVGAIVAIVFARTVTPLAERSGDAPVPGRDVPMKLLAIGCGAAMAISMIAALAIGKPWQLRVSPPLRATPIGATDLQIGVPEAAIANQASSGDGDVRHYLFSAIDELPFESVEITDGRVDDRVGPDAIAAELDEARAALANYPPQGLSADGTATKTSLGGRLVVHQRFKGTGLGLVDSYVLFAGRHELRVEVNMLGDAPPAWTDLPDRIVASIAVRGAD